MITIQIKIYTHWHSTVSKHNNLRLNILVFISDQRHLSIDSTTRDLHVRSGQCCHSKFLLLAFDVVRYGQLWPNLLFKLAKKITKKKAKNIKAKNADFWVSLFKAIIFSTLKWFPCWQRSTAINYTRKKFNNCKFEITA